MNNRPEPRKSLFDIILENSKVAEKPPTENAPNTQAVKSFYWFGYSLRIFIFPWLLLIAWNVFVEHFKLPSFSYFEFFKIYLGVLVIKQILKPIRLR